VLVVRGRKGAFLYSLLTYPLMKAYGKVKNVALSSDAFTQSALLFFFLPPSCAYCRIRFGRHGALVHNEEVFDCFYWLLGTHIPNFVNEACFRWCCCFSINSFHVVHVQVLTQNRPLTQNDLVQRLHEWGINLRLLGFVRSLFKSAIVSLLCGVELSI